MDHPAVSAAATEPDPVKPDVGDLAPLDRDAPRAVGHDHRGDAEGGLAVAVPVGRQGVAGVAEGQPLERQVLDEFAVLRPPFDPDELLGDGCDDLGRGEVFARQWDVGQRPVAVEEPLARRVEGGGEVLQVVALRRPPLQEGPVGGAGQGHEPRTGLDGGDAVPRGLPRVVRDHRHVGEPILGQVEQRPDVVHARRKARLARSAVGALPWIEK